MPHPTTPVIGDPRVPIPRAPSTDQARPLWSQYLTELRTGRRLSCTEAARRMGIAPQTWAGIEAGTRTRNGRRITVRPKEETLQRISDALGLTKPEYRNLVDLVASAEPIDSRGWQARLKSARTLARVTPQQAARYAGVTIATYKSWERKTTGSARHDALRRLLPHLGMTSGEVDTFMATVPAENAPARAPRQPSNPVDTVPAWSQFITTKRISLGMHLATVDAILGQTSIIRRYELGGWRRADGRLSVPSHEWLNRIAAALSMSPNETAHLHTLADAQRLTVAMQSTRPLTAEILAEARRAVGLSKTEAHRTVGPLPLPWSRFEQGDPAALTLLNASLANQIITALPVRPVLAAAILGSIHAETEPAENRGVAPDRDLAVPASA